jgi:hypothetical protein
MPNVELKTSVREGRVVVAPRGELGITSEAVSLAAACGEHCTPGKGSAIAYWYRVIAARAAAVPMGSQPRR